jgi:cytochrome b involved in lipid metabolism
MIQNVIDCIVSCYLTFQVYDVTPFMDEHPGGDEVLLAVTGKSFFVSFHSG